MKEIAEVVAIDGQRITLSTQLKTACSGCTHNTTCGAGILSKGFADRNARFTVESDLPVNLGDRVEVVMDESDFTRYALLLYGLPIVGLLLIAALLTHFSPLTEGIVILLAFSGFGAIFVGLKHWFRQRDVKVQQLIQINVAAA